MNKKVYISLAIIVVVVAVILFGREQNTYLVFQQNGKPLTGVTCHIKQPTINVQTDSKGMITLNSDIIRLKDQVIFLTLKKENRVLYKGYLTIKKGAHFTYNFTGGSLVVNMKYSWAWFQIDETQIMPNVTFKNPDENGVN